MLGPCTTPGAMRLRDSTSRSTKTRCHPAKGGMKYVADLESPVPRANVEVIVVRCCSPMSLDYKPDEDRRAQVFCKHLVPTNGHESFIVGGQ